MIDDLSLWFDSMQHFHFLRPYWLLIFVVIIYILRAFSMRDDSLAQWRDLMSTQILNNLTVSGNNNKWLSPKKMSLILSVPLCIALMGPTWKQQPSPFSENNAPLIIALDVSKTMEQGDVQPSRLLRAKQKIIELLELRGDSKTALIAFSGSAHVVMPITNDREMIRHFLDALSDKIMPLSGKLPETILPLAEKLLAKSEVPGTVLLVTDGATNNTVKAFEQFFDTHSAQLLVWAIGLEAAQLSDSSNTQNDDTQSDSAQNSDTNGYSDNQSAYTNSNNIIPLQLEPLKTLASKSGGHLQLMSNDDGDVKRVNNYIKNNIVIVDDNSRPWHDSGYPMVFVIAAIFLFWFRKGWTLQW
ncbi:VWA domain-containing protein [Colwellia sp. E2M01]|uniref:VWA domain-containing protein n=1 Tax=Colwellia sp. E2M01 TaxID=2841561 RepID=UPI001C09E679|nr:VWA domain-containing protein [Colwellia sp. E2M01]MBU2870910.1 VWA domain-containing protein [Colwellia sp. E2M01]